MRIIELTNTCTCASEDDQQRDYVFYTGGVAGISDVTVLESDSKPVERRSDEVQFERHGIHSR